MSNVGKPDGGTGTRLFLYSIQDYYHTNADHESIEDQVRYNL